MKLVGTGQSSTEGGSGRGANCNITHICRGTNICRGTSEDGASSRRKYRRVAFKEQLINHVEDMAPSLRPYFQETEEEEEGDSSTQEARIEDARRGHQGTHLRSRGTNTRAASRQARAGQWRRRLQSGSNEGRPKS